MRGDIFDIGCAGDAGRHIGAGDLEANAMPAAKQISRGHDLNILLGDFPGDDLLLWPSGERVPWPPRFGSRWIDGAVRSLEPAAGQFPLGQIVGYFAFAL